MSAIKAGDLVIVMRGHCVHKLAGSERTVEETMEITALAHCQHCGNSHLVSGSVARIYGETQSGWVPFAWLMKIDPPAVPDSVKRDESVTA